jgi:DNA polymerase epsilon subunit 2
MKKVKNITFVSNPFRIRFYTQEMVFFREDLMRKAQRNTVLGRRQQQQQQEQHNFDHDDGEDLAEVDPVKSGDGEILFGQLVQTVLSQAHLLPLPLDARPIYWDMDHALRLTPLPHLLVLADHVDQYQYSFKGDDENNTESEGCQALNPGSFSSDFSFVVYYPASKAVEFSKV